MKSDYSNTQKKIKVQSEEEKIHDSEQYHVAKIEIMMKLLRIVTSVD